MLTHHQLYAAAALAGFWAGREPITTLTDAGQKPIIERAAMFSHAQAAAMVAAEPAPPGHFDGIPNHPDTGKLYRLECAATINDHLRAVLKARPLNGMQLRYIDRVSDVLEGMTK
jgi:hypothetical protein